MVSQFLVNQGKIIVINEEVKANNSIIVWLKLFLFLANFKIINRKGKQNSIIPVGLIKNIKPNEKPEKIENLLKFFLSKYHFVKKNRFNVLKEVSDKSIK